MRNLFATTCLTPVVIGLFAFPAVAQTTIGATQTTPVATATASSGAASDISITSAGAVNPASGVAVTINSNNNVTNAGGITISNADNSVGIQANDGVTGSITNSGTITVNESYTRTDANGDGILDGPFAQGTNRFGIQTLGTLNGSVTNSGTITVQGNNSAGIALGGTLNGALSQTGTVTVTGNNSVGVSAGAVTGNVALAGTISATGGGASGVQLNGDIGGTLVVQSTITSTGYSSTTLPANPATLTPDDLLQGGPAMQIAGSVAGGALFTAAATTTDSSGNSVTTTVATLTSTGAAPALLVGSSTRDITLGSVASDTNGSGLVLNGAATGAGIYDGVAANAVVIGGQGGAVSVANGVTVGGTITATANDATAIALRIGSKASVPTIINSGTISAAGSVAATDTTTAIQIDSGASVQSITNSGTIGAVASAATSSASAILDRSGTLTGITNTGTISATGGAAGQNVAIDLSAGNLNETVNQTAPSSGTTTPAITGDIRFGGGNDALAVSAGTVTGNVSFGGGTNSMALSNAASFTGNADFGGGSGSLSIGNTASFNGTLSNSAGLAVQVTGGSLNITGGGATQLGSLSVTNGTLGVTVNGTTGAYTSYVVGGNASFGTGSNLTFHFQDITKTAGTYSVVQAGSISGSQNLSVVLPYILKGTVTTQGNTLQIDVAQKSTTDLGLNRSGTAAYGAIMAAIAQDKPIGDSFLSINDAATFNRSLRTMLPDHAGGAFDTVSSGSRATARVLADPDAPLADYGKWGFWLQQVGWGGSKSIGDTAGYNLIGWGASGGAEIQVGDLGRFGLSASYLAGTDDDLDSPNEVHSNQYELGAYWRSDWGPFHAFARGSIATIDFKSHRHFEGMDGATEVLRNTTGAWNGKMYSGTAGMSYKLQIGSFSLRPQGSIDYYHLREGSYSETGGGVGMDLIVDGRVSDEFAANGAVALGYSFFDQTADEGGFLRAELEGGRRQIISGTLGATTAHFAGGQDFTLTPEDRASGWTGAFRLKGGNGTYVVSGEFTGEREQGRFALALRAGLQVGF